MEHAHQLAVRHGFDVTLATMRADVPPMAHRRLPDVSCVTLEEACKDRYDVAVATLWRTCYRPVRRARRPVRVLRPEPRGPILRARRARRARPCRHHARAPVSFITEARWIADMLARDPPGRAVLPRTQRSREGRLHASGVAAGAADTAAAHPPRGPSGRLVQGPRRGRGGATRAARAPRDDVRLAVGPGRGPVGGSRPRGRAAVAGGDGRASTPTPTWCSSFRGWKGCSGLRSRASTWGRRASPRR